MRGEGIWADEENEVIAPIRRALDALDEINHVWLEAEGEKLHAIAVELFGVLERLRASLAARGGSSS